jgi:Fe-S cluster assembly iron-binding protein IscA
MLGLIWTVQSQEQVVVNSDFRMGLYSWEAVIVSPPATITASGCSIWMWSDDDACIDFYTPTSSEGYIRQVLYIPADSAHLEIRYRSFKMLLRLYVRFVELDENKTTEFLIEPSSEATIWRKQISHLSGKNVELRFGVKGEGCTGYDCRTQIDYIRIIVYSITSPTTNISTLTLTSAQTQTVVKTYITTIPITETVRENRTVTLTAYATVYSTATSTKTNILVLTTTIALTNTMVQLPLFSIGIDVLQYISIIGALTVAVGFSMLIYEGLQPSHERKAWRVALGFALPYAFFAGIIVWQIIPLFFRPASLISIFADYVYFLLILAFLAIFVIPTVIILYYIRMLSQHSKRSA